MHRIHRQAFARAIVAGRTQAEALALAGGRTTTPASASRTAGRLLARPDVQQLVQYEKCIARFGPIYGPLVAIMDDEDATARDRIRAARLVYRRTGML